MTDKPVSSRTFSSEDIKTTPGSIGDPMRTLDVSAQVVSNSDLQAIPIIGGDEADGILTLMDGFPITYPYRMLGSFSLFNPLTTKRIELLTAGYPVWSGGYAPTAIRVDSKSEYQRPSEHRGGCQHVCFVRSCADSGFRQPAVVGKDRRSLLEYRNGSRCIVRFRS